MVSFISKLRGFVEEFPLRFVQDSHQIFFWIWDQESLQIRSFSLMIWGGFESPKNGYGLITFGLITGSTFLLCLSDVNESIKIVVWFSKRRPQVFLHCVLSRAKKNETCWSKIHWGLAEIVPKTALRHTFLKPSTQSICVDRVIHGFWVFWTLPPLMTGWSNPDALLIGFV